MQLNLLVAFSFLGIVLAQSDPNPVQLGNKPAGLPDVNWDILRIDPPSRENLCQRQVAYCSTNCGGPSEAVKNFCNATTMAWGCGCSKKTPDFTPFLWPVVQAECAGKAQECQLICNKDRKDPSTCAATCNAYYQCGTDKAPPSFLQTDSPSDMPSYDGPIKAANTTANNGNANSDSHSNSGAVFKATNFVAAATTILIATLFF